MSSRYSELFLDILCGHLVSRVWPCDAVWDLRNAYGYLFLAVDSLSIVWEEDEDCYGGLVAGRS